MKMLNTLTSNAYHDLIDYNVVDQSGDNVGSLHSLWSDQNTGALEFLGVKTGWLFGKNHVVPAEKAQIDEENRFIQIPFAAAFIKEAPSIAADAEITEEQEAEIYRYYGMSGAGTATATAAADAGMAATTDYAAAAGTTTVGGGTTISDLGRTGNLSDDTTATAAADPGDYATTAGRPAASSDYGTTTAAGGTTREARAGETIEVPVQEEQLRVGKREVEAGSVRLRKVVRTETVNQPVELRREEVVVERVPADQVRAGSTGTAFQEGEEIVVPVRREEAVVGKDTVTAGAVRVRKDANVEQQNVSETIRKEDVEVDRGGVGVTHGSTAGAATSGTQTGYGTTTGGASMSSGVSGGSPVGRGGRADYPDADATGSTRTDYPASGTTGATGAAGTGTFADVTGSSYTENDRRASGDVNPDPITGEPGSHPVGTGIGAVSGAATGAAMGSPGGPVGAVIGGIAGAVTGGLIGKGVEEYFDPTEEAAYWRENYRSSSYYDPSMSYEDYEPAYRSGYTGFGKYYGEGRRFEDVEPDIRRDYEGSGASMTYDKARNSVKDAYDRLFHRASAGQRRSSTNS